MVSLELPNDQDLLAAAGKVAMAHAQLDYVLQMTVKSLAGVSVREALDATASIGSKALRDEIKKLLRGRVKDGVAILKMRALLERARRVTERRNKLIHRPWAKRTDDFVVKDDDHNWGPLPTSEDLHALCEEITALVLEINDARVRGFLAEALRDARAETSPPASGDPVPLSPTPGGGTSGQPRSTATPPPPAPTASPA